MNQRDTGAVRTDKTEAIIQDGITVKSRLCAVEQFSLHILRTKGLQLAQNLLFEGHFYPGWLCSIILIASLHTIVKIVLIEETPACWLAGNH